MGRKNVFVEELYTLPLMDSWEGVAGVIGAVVAIIALAKSVATDRRIRIMETRWDVTHFENQAYLLTNRQPYVAYDVRIESSKPPLLDNAATQLLPNEDHKFLISDRYTMGREALEISWSRRPGGKRYATRRYAPPLPK